MLPRACGMTRLGYLWRRWLLQRKARAAIRRGEGCVIAGLIAAGRWSALDRLEAK